MKFKDIEPSMLELINTSIADKKVEIEMDQSKRNYLHPVEGSEAAKMGAGLFKN